MNELLFSEAYTQSAVGQFWPPGCMFDTPDVEKVSDDTLLFLIFDPSPFY